jgi:hypothetical protein
MNSRIISLLDDIRGVLFAVILAPLYISSSEIIPTWDDAFYLRSTVCVARSFWEFDLKQLDWCLSQMPKSPVMGFLSIPAGPGGSGLEKLAVGPFVLSFLTAAFVLLLAHLTKRARIPLIPALVAAGAAIATPSLWSSGVPFMVDGLLAVVVACTVMILIVEWEVPTATWGESIGRAALWALLLNVGIVSKTTYGVIALPLGMIAVWVSWRRSGLRSSLIKFVALSAFLMPAVVMIIRYGSVYLAHAKNASFGTLSVFFPDGLTPLSFLAQMLGTNWLLWLGCAALIGWAAWRPAGRGRMILASLAAVVIVSYLILAAASPNRDPRFFWLVWLTLPFCFASAISPDEKLSVAPSWAWIQIVAILVLTIPAIGRLNLNSLRLSIETLNLLPAGAPITVVLATDDYSFNNETMLLAQQLDWEKRSKIQISTVVYDIVTGIDVESSMQKLRDADFAIGQFQVPAVSAPWANRNAPLFEKTLRESGRTVSVVAAPKPISIFSRGTDGQAKKSPNE